MLSLLARTQPLMTLLTKLRLTDAPWAFFFILALTMLTWPEETVTPLSASAAITSLGRYVRRREAEGIRHS